MSQNDEAKDVTVHFSCLIVCNPTLANDVFSWICLVRILCFRVSLDIEIRYVISQSKQIKDWILQDFSLQLQVQSLQLLFQFTQKLLPQSFERCLLFILFSLYDHHLEEFLHFRCFFKSGLKLSPVGIGRLRKTLHNSYGSFRC